MPPPDGNPSVQFVRLRVTRLSATGAPVTGATGGYITGSMMELADSPDIERGQEINVRNGAGELCVDFRDPDLVKRRLLTLTICGVEDELFELLTGADLITDGGSTIGHADPPLGEEGNPDGVALEGWSKNLVGGGQSSTLPWFRWLYPRTYGWTRGEDRLLNGHLAWTFTGIAIENDGMPSDGPFGDMTLANPERVRAVYRTADDPPTAAVGYASVPA